MGFQKVFATLLLVGGLTTAGQAQQIVRYQLGSKHYTAARLDSVVAAATQKMKAKMPDIQLTTQIISTETRGDTLLHQVKITGGNAAVIVNRASYQNFVGQPLPPFELRTPAGQKLRSSDLLGKPLVLNLWFTTCPPCVAEMPAFNKFKAENLGTSYVAITFDEGAKVTEFLKKQPFDFTHLIDGRAYCEQFTISYPLTIFVDKQGVIRHINQGLPMRYDVANKRPGTEADMTEFRAAWQAIQ